MANIEPRKHADGTISYRVRVRRTGAPTQYATFTRKTDAVRWATSGDAVAQQRRFFPELEATNRTVAELIKRYTETVIDRSPRDGTTKREHLRWWAWRLEGKTLANVMPGELSRCKDDLIAGKVPPGTKHHSRRRPARSAATVNRYLATLSHAFSVAMKEWQWVDDSPFRRVSKLREPRGRCRFLSDEERTRLLKEAARSENPHLYCLMVLALSTGMRRGEQLSSRWQQVDLDRGVITLHETKNGERRGVPLAGYALQLLKQKYEHRDKAVPLLFPSATKPGQPIEIKKAWDNALRRAEITDFRWHDLRHSAASYLAMSGASLSEIAEVLGHKTLAMVKRYSHMSVAHTQRVVTAMNNRIFENSKESEIA